MKISEIFKIRDTDPDSFYEQVFTELEQEYSSAEFNEQLNEVLKDACIKFTQKASIGASYPFHQAYMLPPIENCEFRYFIQVCADNENQCPLPIITGIIPFPNETYYTFHLHDDGMGDNEIDVFTPHFIERYAKRSFRLGTDIELPRTWHHEKRSEFSEKLDEKDYRNLFMFIGKFFGRNKTNRLCKNDGLLSEEERKNPENKIECLWMDGLSYCIPFANNKVFLHKTFLPYEELKKNQINKQFFDDFGEFCKDAKDLCPNQYGELALCGEILKHFKF